MAKSAYRFCIEKELDEAVKYKEAFFTTYQKALKKKRFKTVADKKAFRDGYD